jgi:hypothetical protein
MPSDNCRMAYMFLATTHIGYVAATSAVATATSRIGLICVHGFTFIIKQ